MTTELLPPTATTPSTATPDTATPPTGARSTAGGPPSTGSTSRRRAAVVAGVGYVAIFVLAVFANFIVVEGMIETGDAAATMANVEADGGLFRLGLVAFLAVFLLDVVIAWALWIVFRDHDRDLSSMAAWLRLVYTVFLGVGLVFFFQVLRLTGDATDLSAFDRAQLESQVMGALDLFDATWLVGLAAFGLHLVLLGGLIVGSRLAPRPLGGLLIVAGVAYVADTVARALLVHYASVEGLFLALVAVPSVVGEGWLGLWLLLRAFRSSDVTARPAGA